MTDTQLPIEDSQKAGCQPRLVRRFRCLPSCSLGRMIERGEDKEECREEWSARYGHEYPIRAIINGKEIKE